MKYVKVLMLLIAATVFAEYQRRYEGINPNWKGAEGVEARLSIIKGFLQEDPTVFEVGAKDGEDTVKLARMWPAGKIISFEANPNQFRVYEQRAREYSNMYGYNLAVNTYNGFATFYLCWGTGGTDPVFEGASSLLPPSEAMKIHYMGPEITVPCVILDDWCKSSGVAAIDFMWLDLEGFELQFLKSSPKVLKTTKVVYSETNFFKFRKGITFFNELRSFLETAGFKLVAHWYTEGLQGDAIFVRKSLLHKKK